MSLLADLGDSGAKRSKSAQKLTDYVLSQPDAVVSMSIATLAGEVGVSEPTVNRFCTGLGLKGFPDFKLTLAAELARRQPGMTRDIEADDSSTHVIAKVFESTRASLSRVEAGLDGELVEAAVSMLDRARSIVLCGLGASASVALDAQHKLLRFATPVIAHTDIINQRQATIGLNAGDCMVCISYTGRTRAIVEVAELARERGIPLLGITALNSPLGQRCDLVLPVESDEDTEIYTPMTSRIAQLVVLDVLTTRLALRQGPAFSDQLRAVKDAVADTRSPPR